MPGRLSFGYFSLLRLGNCSYVALVSVGANLFALLKTYCANEFAPTAY